MEGGGIKVIPTTLIKGATPYYYSRYVVVENDGEQSGKSEGTARTSSTHCRVRTDGRMTSPYAY